MADCGNRMLRGLQVHVQGGAILYATSRHLTIHAGSIHRGRHATTGFGSASRNAGWSKQYQNPKPGRDDVLPTLPIIISRYLSNRVLPTPPSIPLVPRFSPTIDRIISLHILSHPSKPRGDEVAGKEDKAVQPPAIHAIPLPFG
jgi:hypothetical protein